VVSIRYLITYTDNDIDTKKMAVLGVMSFAIQLSYRGTERCGQLLDHKRTTIIHHNPMSMILDHRSCTETTASAQPASKCIRVSIGWRCHLRATFGNFTYRSCLTCRHEGWGLNLSTEFWYLLESDGDKHLWSTGLDCSKGSGCAIDGLLTGSSSGVSAIL
jgi:hypothetical protein